jgi:hypothetical protein
MTVDAQQEHDQAQQERDRAINAAAVKALLAAGDIAKPGGIVGRVMEKHGVTETRAEELIRAFGG